MPSDNAKGHVFVKGIYIHINIYVGACDVDKLRIGVKRRCLQDNSKDILVIETV